MQDRRSLISWLVWIWAAALFVVPGRADGHGGAYRGPGDPVPGTRGPAAPVRGPLTVPPRSETGVAFSWQAWWSMNRARFLRLREAVHAGEVLVDGQIAVPLVPTDDDLRKVVLPALLATLRKDDNTEVATAVMVAMAKIGVDGDGVQILTVFRDFLKRPNQEERETAAVCLGISQRPEAIEDLIALAHDTPAGRRLVGSSSVDDRTRAFATYGLGLVAWGQDDVARKSTVFEALIPMLEVDRGDPDLLTAAVSAIGLLHTDANVTAQRRLQWRALETLTAFYEDDIGKARILAQAHVPIAIARLLGRGASADHERYKRMFVAALDGGREDSRGTIAQSAAIALGLLALPREQHAEDAAVSDALLEHHAKGRNDTARMFALMALAEIGGESNRTALLQIGTAAKRLDRAWAALALGVQAFHARAKGGAPDATAAQIAAGILEDSNDDEIRSAAAIAIGLCGELRYSANMLKLAARFDGHDILCSYIAESLGILPDPGSTDVLRKMFDDATRRPLLLVRSGTALAMLGEKDANTRLIDALSDDSESFVKLAALATAFREVGDRRALQPILARLQRASSHLDRAFLAAALGGICEKEPLPWNAKLSSSSNYNAAVVTLADGLRGILDIL